MPRRCKCRISRCRAPLQSQAPCMVWCRPTWLGTLRAESGLPARNLPASSKYLRMASLSVSFTDASRIASKQWLHRTLLGSFLLFLALLFVSSSMALGSEKKQRNLHRDVFFDIQGTWRNLRQKYVARLHVSMHHLTFMEKAQRQQNLRVSPSNTS